MDKLFEDWRKFLVEEEVLEEAFQRVKADDPEYTEKYKDRSTLGNILSYLRTPAEEEESQSDELILELPKKSGFWKQIFAVGDHQAEIRAFEKTNPHVSDDPDIAPGSPIERQAGVKMYRDLKAKSPGTPQEIIQKWREYAPGVGLEGSAEEWLSITKFVLICHRSNIDGTLGEVLGNVSSMFGEGETLAAQAIRWTGAVAPAFIGIGITVATGGTAPAALALLGYLGAGLTGGAVLGTIASSLNDWVDKVDAIELSKDMQDKLDMSSADVGVRKGEEATGPTGEYEPDRGVTLKKLFHECEYAVLKPLSANPHQLPTVNIPEILKGEAPGRYKENNFHDNWRNFLLTEDKK
jgi:hypothetical protein